MTAAKLVMISSLLSIWILGAAILSVQNATLVRVQFGPVQVEGLPVGVVLMVSAGTGMLATSALVAALGLQRRTRHP
ncbi:MAG: hypothetical protein IGQ88_13610 [Gloeomargaritaceae cyanobacterium C42_A2020_066]|nr:hypothetical protein [Gloeomargaritaceae cyanobacterium C42_A2020_066]